VSVVARTFPVTQELSDYPKRGLRPDVVAGITVAAMAIPSAMAFASTAGLSPVAGLYALLLPVIAYAFLGSSRQLVVGPEGAISLLVATSIAPLAAQGSAEYASLAALLALLVAAIYLLAYVVRLGWIADYFSRAVLVGYIHGVALVLIIGQLGKLFGVPIDAENPLRQIQEFLGELDAISWTTTLVSAISIAVLLLLKLRFPKVPGALVVVVGGILASVAFDLVDHGVRVVGAIPAGLPSVEVPAVSASSVADLLPAALGIFAVGFADSVLTARAFAGRHNQRIDANQELLAQGMANAGTGFTQAFPVGASGSRTAVNDQMGAKTQVVGLVSAAAVALVLLFLTAPCEQLPMACLGAIIVVAAAGLFSVDDWRALRAAGTGQVVIAGVTVAVVVAAGVLEALIAAVVLSILDVIARSSRPHDAVLGWVPRLGRYADVSVHPSARVTPGVVVYRLDDRLFFANARYFRARVREAIAGAPTPTRWLVFDAQFVNDVDASGAEAVDQLCRQLADHEVTFVVARLSAPVKDRFDATGLTDRIGETRFHPTLEAAVRACVAADRGRTGGYQLGRDRDGTDRRADET
jgi:high affinity sulfate transporter 1